MVEIWSKNILILEKKHDDILEMQCAPVCVNILYKA